MMVHHLWQYITYDATSAMTVHHLWHRNTSWWTALPDPPECESRNFVMMHWCGRRSTALWTFLLQTLTLHWDLKAMQLPCCCRLNMFQCCWRWCWLFQCGQRNRPQLQFYRGKQGHLSCHYSWTILFCSDWSGYWYGCYLFITLLVVNFSLFRRRTPTTKRWKRTRRGRWRSSTTTSTRIMPRTRV